MTCSSAACAPPPTAPRPSSVGTPIPAVKLPSDAPPTAASVSGGRPSLAATSLACWNSAADAVRSSGARLAPPVTSTTAPGTTARKPWSAESTRACSAAVHILTSTDTDASAGTVLVVVPDSSTVGVTVVPRSGSAKAAMASTWWASSTDAFTPSSGSRPAWAARPCTVTRYSEAPFLAVLIAPPSAEASSTNAAEQPAASVSISCLEVGDPSSSSPVMSTVTPSLALSAAAAWSAITTPAFMSKQPGPLSTPSTFENGCVASDPIGQTVSWWPSSNTREGRSPSRHTRWWKGPEAMRSGSTPRRKVPRAATVSALDALASASRDGDSQRTNRSRSESTSASTVSPHFRRRASTEMHVTFARFERIERHRHPVFAFGGKHHEEVVIDRNQLVLVDGVGNQLSQWTEHDGAQHWSVVAVQHLHAHGFALVDAQVWVDCDVSGHHRWCEGRRHRDIRNFGEYLAEQVFEQVADIAAIGMDRHRESLLRKDSQGRPLPEGAAIVANHAVPVPSVTNPAETPRVTQGVLVGQVGLVGGHRGRGLLAQQASAVRGKSAGEMQPRELERVSNVCRDEPCRAERARERPRRHGLQRLARCRIVADRRCVQHRLLGQRHGSLQPQRGEESLLQGLVPSLARDLLDNADRKSTRLNSSHVRTSYAVFCLKKKKTPNTRYACASL